MTGKDGMAVNKPHSLDNLMVLIRSGSVAVRPVPDHSRKKTHRFNPYAAGYTRYEMAGGVYQLKGGEEPAIVRSPLFEQRAVNISDVVDYARKQALVKVIQSDHDYCSEGQSRYLVKESSETTYGRQTRDT